MIKVKGTKSASTVADSSQRFVHKSGDESSRTPQTIAGVITGVAAYLGSIFAWASEEEEPPGRRGDDDAGWLQSAGPIPTRAAGSAAGKNGREAADSAAADSEPTAYADTSGAPGPDQASESELIPAEARSASEPTGEGPGIPVVAADTAPFDQSPPAGDPPPAAESGADDPAGEEDEPEDDDDPTDVEEPADACDCGCSTDADAAHDCDPLEPEADGEVEIPLVAGTAAGDLLLGGMGADEIDGKGGDDSIDGRAGDDVIAGGSGDDNVVAGAGNDTVMGGDGNDILFGRAGSDHVFGEGGNDRLFGDDADDVLFGNDGEDRLDGGDGDDLLLGGAGDDVIVDGAGRDSAMGDVGSDRVIAALDRDDDLYDGGGDSDTLDYEHATEGILVDFVSGVASGLEIGQDSIIGFENVHGGRGDDRFVLSSASITLTGGAGDDVFVLAGTEGNAPVSPAHEITDFQVGDRIRMEEYDIFLQPDDEPADRFGQIYLEDDDSELPIRYRHDRDAERERTVIETDLDGDGAWVTAVTLQGIHEALWFSERDETLDGQS